MNFVCKILALTTVIITAVYQPDIAARGVGPQVVIRTQRGTQPAQEIYDNTFWHKIPFAAWDQKSLVASWHELKAIAKGRADGHLHISTDNREVLCVLPDLYVYRVDKSEFIPLHTCAVGDMVYTNYGPRVITLLEWRDEPLDVYELEIADHHTYCIGRYEMVVHNMTVPLIVASGSGGILSGGTLLASVGTYGGPIIAAVFFGLGCAGVAGYQWWTSGSRYGNDFVYTVAQEMKGAEVSSCVRVDVQELGFDYGEKAPGKPTAHDGYTPPKNWDGKKRPAPGGGGYGWPDDQGNIWVPSGENGHGGPHWDVQYPKGGYQNILPGGKIRGK